MELYTAVLEAVRDGDISKVQQLYNSSINSWTLSQKYDFLCASLHNNHRNVTIFLVSKKCPMNINYADHKSPLHIALDKKNYEIIRLLVLKHANIYAYDEKGLSPLKIALSMGNESLIQLMFRCNIHVKTFNTNKYLPFCVSNGYERITELYLKKGADVDVLDLSGKTALCYAAEKGLVHMVSLLLHHNASVDLSSGDTPLILAIKNRHIEISQILLKKGASVCTARGASEGPIHVAVDKKNWVVETFSLLVSHGADVNEKCSNGSTALHIAIQSGCYGAVTSILYSKADVNIQDNDGQMPLHISVENGLFGIAKLLQHGALVNIRNRRGKTPLHIATEKKNMSALKYLLQHGADIHAKTTHNGDEALHIAVRQSNLLFTKILVESQADVNARNRFGKIPLHVAVEIGNVSIVEYLLKCNSNVDSIITDVEGCSTLMLAVQKCHIEIIQKLLDSNVNINYEDTRGMTALHLAVKKKSVDIVNLLLKNKPSVESRGNKNSLSTAILTFDDNDLHIIDLLVAYGFIPNAEEASNNELLNCALKKGLVSVIESLLNQVSQTSALCTAIQNLDQDEFDHLINLGVNCEAQDSFGKSPLYYAVTENNVRAVELLLKNNVSITNDLELVIISAIKCCSDETLNLLLDYVGNNLSQCQGDPISTAVLENNFEAVELLLKYKVPVKNNSSILHHSIRNRNNPILCLLLDHGVMNAENVSSSSLIYEAMNSNNEDTVKILLARGVSVKDQPELLFLAIEKNFNSILHVLLDHEIDVNAKDKDQNSLISTAVISKNAEAVQMLLNKKISINDEPPELLLYPIINHNGFILRSLVEHGADINAKGAIQNSNNPLCRTAASFSRWYMCCSTKFSNLIEQAGINVQDFSQISPIFTAVMTSNTEAVSVLLDNNVSITNEPYLLHIAVLSNCNSIFHLLLNYGADINVRDGSQKSLMYNAVKASNTEAVMLLLEKNLSVHNEPDLIFIAIYNSSEQIVNILIEQGVDINSSNSEGITPLHEAIKGSKTKIVNTLVAKGALLNARTKVGETYLHIAAKASLCVLKLVTELGIDINAVDSFGNTVLHTMASIKSRHHAVAWTLKQKINDDLVNRKNKLGDTPLVIAARTGNSLVLAVLLQHGAIISDSALPLAARTKSPRTVEHLLNYCPSIDEETIFDIITKNSTIKNSMLNKLYLYCFKRKCANMFLNDEFFVSKIKEVAPVLRAAVEQDCVVELNLLKNRKIEGSSITFYKLLHMNSTQIAAMFKNGTITQKVTADNEYRRRFLIFGDMIQGRLINGKVRNHLLDGINKLSFLPCLPFYCVQHILTFLNNEDLYLLLGSF